MRAFEFANAVGEGVAEEAALPAPATVPGGDEEAEVEAPGFAGIIGRHRRMQAMFDVIRRVAGTNATVLITGESGTGKELVAQAIHTRSRRRLQRLVPVHCGAIPEDLLESEMFGHERGAFTGAICSRVGRFRLADGGTIFLDEIGDMSPKLQVKLLRVLENGMFEPVGGVTTQCVDVRVVAATNRNLEEAVGERRFREDLYYRLRVVPIEMPPLRERREDIPLLVEWFLGHLHGVKGMPRFEITEDAMGILGAYHWPGNVRELKNLLEQLVVLGDADCVIRPEHLPSQLRGGGRVNASGGWVDAAMGLRPAGHRFLSRDGVDRGSHHRPGAAHQSRQQEGGRAPVASQSHDAAREAQAQARGGVTRGAGGRAGLGGARAAGDSRAERRGGRSPAAVVTLRTCEQSPAAPGRRRLTLLPATVSLSAWKQRPLTRPRHRIPSVSPRRRSQW